MKYWLRGKRGGFIRGGGDIAYYDENTMWDQNIRQSPPRLVSSR